MCYSHVTPFTLMLSLLLDWSLRILCTCAPLTQICYKVNCLWRYYQSLGTRGICCKSPIDICAQHFQTLELDIHSQDLSDNFWDNIMCVPFVVCAFYFYLVCRCYCCKPSGSKGLLIETLCFVFMASQRTLKFTLVKNLMYPGFRSLRKGKLQSVKN